MSPFRLIILFILFYLLYRLLTSGRQESRKKGVSPKAAQTPTRDVLVEDPVCHVYIPKAQAVTWQWQEVTHHFCSKKCREEYITAHSGKTASKEKNS